ncbi:uncharacterized protein FFB20_14868 [Fusarium fujikuroi]|nr:uncharacterized protein FFB20_14868 [Fusarium fujikuroi]SCO20711.1 uncharacterized protein FFC1_13815 [Fusarium fujikuroi]SCO45514.1 uncharacterized protein FFNC_10335 [Fusarium fujikuroi]
MHSTPSRTLNWLSTRKFDETDYKQSSDFCLIRNPQSRRGQTDSVNARANHATVQARQAAKAPLCFAAENTKAKRRVKVRDGQLSPLTKPNHALLSLPIPTSSDVTLPHAVLKDHASPWSS